MYYLIRKYIRALKIARLKHLEKFDILNNENRLEKIWNIGV